VKECWIARNATRKRRAFEELVGIPIAEVARFTGHSTRELMDLVRAGALEQIPGRRACQLTSDSLRAWMGSRDDDDLALAVGMDAVEATRPFGVTARLPRRIS
jgi:hypothetical protein